MCVFAVTNDIGTPSEAIATMLSERIGATLLIHDDITGYPHDKVIDIADWQDRRVSHVDPWTLREAIVGPVLDAAARGNAVIQGCCAPAILAHARHVIRVRIVGSIEERTRAVMGSQPGGDVASAVEMLRAADAECAEFAETFFGADLNAPGLYDLTLNSDRLCVENCVALLCEHLEHWGRRQSEAGALASAETLLEEAKWSRRRFRTASHKSKPLHVGPRSPARHGSPDLMAPQSDVLALAEEALYGKLPYGTVRANFGNTGTRCGD